MNTMHHKQAALVVTTVDLSKDLMSKNPIVFLHGFDQTMSLLQAEHAKLKRLYQLAVAELDRGASSCMATAEAQDLRDYVEDRVQARTAALAARAAELERLAHTDHLTGLPNRRAFLQTAHGELARMQRNDKPACIVMGDIDHFKAFNDCCGHAAGDRVLQAVAASLRSSLRAADTVARWGGEEFIVLLPETDVEGAKHAAEKCRLAVQTCAQTCRDHLNPPARMTMTFGVSVISPNQSIESVIAQADSALYLGKNAGRNRVVVAQCHSSS